MRKLILIAAIALMSTSSCYANLSLADASPTATQEPVKKAADAEADSNERPSHVVRRRQKHLFNENLFTLARLGYRWNRPCW
jgi:hypothetical protein